MKTARIDEGKEDRRYVGCRKVESGCDGFVLSVGGAGLSRYLRFVVKSRGKGERGK